MAELAAGPAVRLTSGLRVIDDAWLDQLAEDEPTQETLVVSYRWLLRRVGEGLCLTQAGYLPPAVVTEAVVPIDTCTGIRRLPVAPAPRAG